MRGHYVRGVWQSAPGGYAPAKRRRACEYDAFIPDPLGDIEPPLPGDIAGITSDAEQAIVGLNAQAVPALAPLARLLLRTESIASSKVEGIQTDARTLARAEVRQDTGGRIGNEAAEILSNVDAMQLAIEQASSGTSVTLDSIIDVHRLLMRNAPNREVGGRIREVQGWIGGNDYNPCDADYVSPPPEEIDPLMDDLVRFAGSDTLPPIVQAALAHAQFETIHPFADGNGRTGRALVQVILRRRGLAPGFVPPISVMLARDKDTYVQGLTVFREDRLAEWIEVFAVAARRAADLAKIYVARVQGLQQEWREKLKSSSSPRSDAAAWTLIDILPAHPVITVPVGVAASGRTKPAVTGGVEELEGAGVLRRLGESRRNRAWEAEDLLDLIVELEAGRG